MKNKKFSLSLFKRLLLIVLVVLSCSANAQGQLLPILKQEAEKNLEILKKEKIPAYYISYRVTDETMYVTGSSFGELTGVKNNNQHNRFLHIVIRVGNRTFDNTHDGTWGGNAGRTFGMVLPYEDDPTAIRMALWQNTESLYKKAAQSYEEQKAKLATQIANKDTSPDFSLEKREQYSARIPKQTKIYFDTKEFAGKLKQYTLGFCQNKDLIEGNAIAKATLRTISFADTEGASIAQYSADYIISLYAMTMAPDGMNLPLYKSYYASSPEKLPSDKDVQKDATTISDMLAQLRNAPLADPYNGPALLSANAAGVFFHEFFGHRVEGTRMKQETDAQTFKNKVGELILAPDMNVTFDPTLQTYKSLPLSGHYLFDDEGVRGQRVEVVKDGILKSFLMARTELTGFPNSNGHARATPVEFPVTRQSNMIIESNTPKSTSSLRELFKEELRSQKLPFGYWFKEVSGGFTVTNRFMPNAFNVTPLIVYKVYAGEQPDELVRGVNMIGTPLAIFSKIIACGNDYEVFNGFCGAESGSIPVACVAPSILVKSVETQKQNTSQQQPYLLPRP